MAKKKTNATRASAPVTEAAARASAELTELGVRFALVGGGALPKRWCGTSKIAAFTEVARS